MAARGQLQRARRAREQREYLEAREAVKQRAYNGCEARCLPECAGLGNQAHHKLMRSHGGPHSPDNLLWVCTPCHNHIHANPERSYDNGWLRKSGL